MEEGMGTYVQVPNFIMIVQYAKLSMEGNGCRTRDNTK